MNCTANYCITSLEQMQKSVGEQLTPYCVDFLIVSIGIIVLSGAWWVVYDTLKSWSPKRKR